MQKFDRGNEIVLSGTFTPVSGTAAPTSAEAILVYTNVNGDTDSSAVTLTDDGSGVWVGSWDSSLSGGGLVEWVIKCAGPVKAATQGKFMVVANTANSQTYG